MKGKQSKYLESEKKNYRDDHFRTNVKLLNEIHFFFPQKWLKICKVCRKFGSYSKIFFCSS